jgi:hypothetical protein
MQSGIAYAAGQLLAVVAPRTVLVVDAPTDWSLAGPLWELALDDAPVDEILDVLVRRGIRTAPSFAIVRVEVDAVRALVRGSVPVCFERVGEPVRLDATGATTWLEGLISGARRVLVGAVETGSSLPYHVSTGVVLVSGLALACGPVEHEDRPVLTPGVVEALPASAQEPAQSDSSSYFAPSTGTPVGAGAGTGSSPALASAGGREPRVVDLTRTGPRTPARAFSVPPRESWALTSARSNSDAGNGYGRELNGHAPAVLEPLPTREPGTSTVEPEQLADSSSLFQPSNYAPAPTTDDPGELLDVDAPAAPDYAPTSDYDSGSSVSSFRSEPEAPASQFSTDFAARPPAQLRSVGPVPAESQPNEPADSPAEMDDLLTAPDEDEVPPGPSPADLPNLTPPSLSLELPSAGGSRGVGVPAQPRGFTSGVPAAWPPAYDSPSEESEPSVSEASDLAGQDGEQGVPSWAAPAQPSNKFDAPGRYPSALPENSPTESSGNEESAESIGDLPLRVRGRSLRPEHAAPLNGAANSAPAPANLQPSSQPSTPNPPFRPITAAEAARMREPGSSTAESESSAPASGSLLLPAFFRGARAARQPSDDITDVATPVEEEAPPSPWTPNNAGPQTPAPTWTPPVRRGFQDRTGFNGGPPAMPGVLRPSTPDSGSPVYEPDSGQVSRLHEVEDLAEEPTEVYPAPGSADADTEHVDAESQSPRESPRLLGVWCDAGHVTSPDREECRVCGLTVPGQAPILVARPPLGVLIFDNGDRVEVDQPVILGRDPKPNPSSPDPEEPLLHPVASATGQVSRTHAEIRAQGWDVVLTDLGAMNGTALTLPGASPIAIEANLPTVITPGARVDLGGETGFVFEVEG